MSTKSGLVLPAGVEVADHLEVVDPPAFWDPRKAYVEYKPDIEGAFLAGVAARLKRNLRTAEQIEADGIVNIAMLTDLQGEFCEYGRLPVIGGNTVVLRVCARLLMGTLHNEYYTRFIYSQDGHVPWHLSYGTRWLQTNKQPLDLREYKAAVLDLKDRAYGVFSATAFGPDGSPIDLGLIQSAFNAADTVAYWDYLQGDPNKPETNQGPIWVFAMHCKLGTDGVNLHPLLAETLAYIEGLRMVSPIPLNKGHIRDTDWFGAFEPCRPDPTHPQGTFQKQIVDEFGAVVGKGKVEFAGLAEDFCQHFTLKQNIDRLLGTPVANHMAFMLDGTAPIVPNTARVRDLYDRAVRGGVKLFNHRDAFELVA